MTTISVVIPSYNDAGMLRGCLAALTRQSRPADEIIVVDNGSTDDTAEVARAAGVTLITQPMRGIFPAMAAGLDVATGDILARLDADSVPPPDWLARIEHVLGSSRGLIAVTGPGEFYGANALVHRLGRIIWIGGLFWSMGLLLGHPPLFGSNFAMPREMWLRVRGTVHSSVRRVHDDLDLSWHLEPDMDVLYDPLLEVAISARPFATPAAIGRRLGRVYTTLALDFREQSPRQRLLSRRRWAEGAHGREGLAT
jgi:glycosyltransferase involved in cell wall biosynthesis